MSSSTERDAISNGMNSRPLRDGLAQSGSGLPDDGAKPLDISPDDEQRLRKTLLGEDGEAEVEAHPS